jgi:hypothetical protein
VRFWCDEDEVDRPHSLVPQIVDPTGHILPLDMTLQFTPPSHPFKPERGNRHTIKVEYPDVSFSEQGDYTFRFLVDGVSMGEYTVDVRKADGVEQP